MTAAIVFWFFLLNFLIASYYIKIDPYCKTYPFYFSNEFLYVTVHGTFLATSFWGCMPPRLGYTKPWAGKYCKNAKKDIPQPGRRI